VVVLGSRDLNEVATREFEFPSSNDLKIRDHPIVFSRVFSVNLAHYE